MTTVLAAPRAAVTKLGDRLGPARSWVMFGAAVLLIGVPYVQSRHLWPFVLTGTSDGAVYSFAALGLVLTFKTSGIFNFAIGAQAATSAYVFYTLRISHDMPWFPAMVLTLVLVGLLGSLVLERLAFWLEEAPVVMRVVATIGIIVLLQSLLSGIYGTPTLHFPPYLSQKQVDVGGTTILLSQIIATVLALIATIGLSVFFRRSRIGLAMQALVDDPELLASEGTSPITIRRYAWAIGSCFCSISGMLIAPVLGIDVSHMLLLYVTAFGAAALGAFNNLGITFVASIMIGIVTNVTGNELAASSNVWVTGLYTQVPFIALVLALLFVPRARLIERGSKRVHKLGPTRRLPAPAALALAAATVALFVALPHLVPGPDVNQYSVGIGFAIVLLSLGLLLWSSGQISLCQMAFAALGASSFAHLQHAGVPWALALVLAGFLTVPAGAIVAIPSFRLTGVYLAVATFGFGLLAQNLLYTSGLMFGLNNAQSITRPHVPGMNADTDTGYYYVAAAIFGACTLLVLAVRRSRLGRILRALADSPAALDAHAVRTKVTRLSVFCLSAFVAALGGAVIGGATLGAGGDPGGPFSYFNSLALIAVLVFCGRRPVLGPVIAAFLFVVAKIYPPMDSQFMTDYRGAFFGGLAIAVAIFPQIRLPHLRERGAERGVSSPVTARPVEDAEAPRVRQAIRDAVPAGAR